MQDRLKGSSPVSTGKLLEFFGVGIILLSVPGSNTGPVVAVSEVLAETTIPSETSNPAVAGQLPTDVCADKLEKVLFNIIDDEAAHERAESDVEVIRFNQDIAIEKWYETNIEQATSTWIQRKQAFGKEWYEGYDEAYAAGATEEDLDDEFYSGTKQLTENLKKKKETLEKRKEEKLAASKETEEVTKNNLEQILNETKQGYINGTPECWGDKKPEPEEVSVNWSIGTPGKGTAQLVVTTMTLQTPRN